MNRTMCFAMALIAGLVATRAEAQGRWYVGPNLGGYGGYGYGYGGVGTAASAEGQAMADIVRAQGMYNAMTSGAMINLEQARGQYIENEKQWTELYQMKQRIRLQNKALADEDRRVRQGRIKEYNETHNTSHLPPRLVSMQLDPSTGKIQWPSALARETFAPQRSEIEKLFESRAHTGTTSELTVAIVKAIKGLQNDLRKLIKEIPTQEYLEARKFLDSLAVEGQVPVG